ncbi:MAG TPA: DUF4167 domain-containing protein [Rhizobiales bacterium]|nr:DUF4167 domain-containing protein [Hyphomicrobiales bacterium]
MRQGQHSRRPRSRGRRQQQNTANRVYDSNGPDVRVRGTASTVAEKYISLSRDAFSMGDRVKAENYLQHAEHYLRIQAEAREAKQQAQQAHQAQQAQQQPQAQQPQAVDPSPEAQARDGGPQSEEKESAKAGEKRSRTRRARPARPQNAKANGGDTKEGRAERKAPKVEASDDLPVGEKPAQEKSDSDDAGGVAA